MQIVDHSKINLHMAVGHVSGELHKKLNLKERLIVEIYI